MDWDNHNKHMGIQKMYDQERPSKLGCSTSQVGQCDVKEGLQNEIKYLENDITNTTERLRVVKEKLKLIEKNKDLEAYINLLNR